ncbi:MAG: TonB-dependent receptor [Bacteroidota bacterium]|nr:TonB-dependent receptor [Bacteroidota bacterium]
MRTLLLILTLSLQVVISQAQYDTASREVRGLIVDSITGDPLSGSHLMASSGTASAIADHRGQFVLHVTKGDTLLAVSHLGYERLVVSLRDLEQTWLNIELQRVAVPIPEVVVEQVSIHEQPTAQTMAMGSSHRVTSRDLERYRFTDPGRALRSVPGLNVQEEDGFGLRPNIGIRGTGAERSSRITVMEDGILTAPAPYAAPSAYYFPNTARMSGIEVRKGASQIRYGPYTTGGAINMVSRPIPSERTLQLSYAGGTEAYRAVNTVASAGSRTLRGMVEFNDLHSHGFKVLDNQGDTGFRKTDLVGKLRWAPDSDGQWRHAFLLKGLASFDLSNETYLGLTAPDFNASPFRRYLGSEKDNMDADYRQLSLRHIMEVGPRISVHSVAYRSRFDRNWYKLDKVTTGDGKAGISSILENPDEHLGAYQLLTGQSTSAEDQLWVKANNRSYLSQGISSELALRSPLSAGEVRLDAGIRLHQDEMDRFQWVDGYGVQDEHLNLEASGTPGSESNRIESATAVSFFVQPTLEFGRYAINGGVRHERIEIARDDFGKADPDRTGLDFSQRSNHVSVWIPGASASIALSESMTIFSGIHRGFSPPGSAEGARPERSVNVETGLRFKRGLTRIDLIGFNNDYSNLLGADVQAAGGSGSGDLFNGGRARVRGLESTASFNLGPLVDWTVSIPIQISHSFTQARFMSSFESDFDPWGTVISGYDLPYVARHTGMLEASLEGARYDVSVRASYVSAMRAESGTGAIPENREIPRHTVLDLGAGWDLSPDSRLFVSIRNLTDSVYIAARRPSGLRPGLPRLVTLGLDVDLTR